MPKICIDKTTSEGEYGTITKVSRTYNLQDYASREAAEQALIADGVNCPIVYPAYPYLTRRPITVDESEVIDIFTADVTWETYTPRGGTPPATGANEIFSGGISTETQHIIRSLKHISTTQPDYGAGPDPKPGGLIGWDGKDSIDGTDTTVPRMVFTQQRDYPKNTFGLPFLAAAMPYVGQPNLTAWYGFAEWEVMLTGVDGTNDSGTDYDVISFTFEARVTFLNYTIETPTELSPNAKIVIPKIRGFDHVWLETEDRIQPDGIRRPIAKAAHVEQIHVGAELNTLLP